MKDWEKKQEEKAKKNKNMTKTEVWAELKKRGIAQAIVQFSGGNDSGGCDAITLHNKDGDVVQELEENYEVSCWEDGKHVVKHNNPTDDGWLANALAEPVFDKYHSFAGEFRVEGTVTWDVNKRTVKMAGSETVDEGFEEDL